MARVSVIIPTYNRRHLLGRAIESVLKQSHRDLRLIVVDDASTDGTPAFLQGLRDPRVEVVRHERNLGAAAARNTGIRRADSEFVAFLDSDDEWLERKLERQLEAFEAADPELGVVFTRFQKIGWRYEPHVARWDGDIRDRILIQNCVGTASTAMLRSACFQDGLEVDTDLVASEDWDLWIRLSERWRFRYLPQTLVHYHPQPVSLTADRGRALLAYDQLFARHAQRIEALPPALRAQHWLHRGRIYYAHRRFAEGSRYLLRAVGTDRSVLPDLSRYLFVETARKLGDRIGVPIRATR
jgi:glycosyltransferase involved in cell wall biosynthesis